MAAPPGHVVVVVSTPGSVAVIGIGSGKGICTVADRGLESAHRVTASVVVWSALLALLSRAAALRGSSPPESLRSAGGLAVAAHVAPQPGSANFKISI